MPFFDPIRIGASGAADTAFSVDRSLRFNDDDSADLQRTPSSASNRRTFTFSFWVKRATLGIYTHIFGMQYSSSANQFVIRFDNDDRLTVFDFQTALGGMQMRKTSDAVFRDVSAWYHIVAAIDTTQSTASNRNRIYVNNVELTTFDNENNPSQNHDTIVNTTNTHYIGQKNSTNYFDGYLAEFHFIDGQQLTPASFAETDATTGQWNPIDTSGLTYGTNGYRLQFADNSGTSATTLGKDTSGNSNNFTPSNFTTGDAVKDSPSNNFAVLNPLSKSSGVTLGEANLFAQGSSGWRTVVGSFHMSSGKWYWEIHIKQVGNSIYGIMPATRANGRQDFYADLYTGTYSDEWGYSAGGTLYNSASGTSNWGSTYTAGDILGFALDMDNGTLDIKKNGSTTGSQITGISTTKEYRASFTYYTSGTKSNINFGQDSSFAGNKTAQGNTDGSGQGDFYYAPPSGYKALCSANLPDPTILLPNKHFDTLLWTANASTQSITGLNFSPDWVWGKSRDDTYDHEVYDTVRGPTKRLKPNATDQELTNSQNLQSFDSNGFTLGSATNMNYNSGSDIVAWNWNAGDTDGKTYTVTVVSDSGNKYRFDGFGTSAVTLDLAEGGTYVFDWSDSSAQSHPIRFSTTSDGTHGGGSEYTTGVTKDDSAYKTTITVAASAPQLFYYCQNHSGMGGAINTNSTLGSSNFDGSTQTIVKANTTAGFSIVSYTGNDTSGSTIGHGLGAVPQITIIKRRAAAEDWIFGIGHILGSGKEGHYIKLNATESEGTGNGPFASTNSSSTVVTIGSDAAVNDNGEPYICYCFSEVAGYSKFGLYTGNGSSSDGTFIFTGFRPAFFICKAISFTKGWRMTDSKRATFNPIYKSLFPELNAAEYTATGTSNQGQDFLSNGVKLRSTNTRDNQSGSTYFFMAFAESPFKNARAR